MVYVRSVEKKQISKDYSLEKLCYNTLFQRFTLHSSGLFDQKAYLNILFVQHYF